MSLYSPSLISKPQYAVKAEYRSPTEWGKRISLMTSILFPRPMAMVEVVHSPAPSTVRMADSSKGEVKKLLAAWLTWWSANRNLERGISRRLAIIDLIQSLSLIQRCMDSRKTEALFGKVAMAVRSMRSNLTKGFS